LINTVNSLNSLHDQQAERSSQTFTIDCNQTKSARLRDSQD